MSLLRKRAVHGRLAALATLVLAGACASGAPRVSPPVPVAERSASRETIDGAIDRIAATFASHEGSVAVLDFPNLDQQPTRIGRLVSQSMTTALVAASSGRRLRVLERLQVDQILKENNFQAATITDADVERVGRALGADALIFGTAETLGGDLVLNVRMVQVRTRTIVAAAKATVPQPESSDRGLAGGFGAASGSEGLGARVMAATRPSPPPTLGPSGACVAAYNSPGRNVVFGLPSQRSAPLTMTLTSVDVAGSGVRVVVEFKHEGGDIGGIALAARARSGGTAVDPLAKVDLVDSRGTRYRLESVSGLAVVSSVDDWTLIGACESRSVAFQFVAGSGSPPERGFSLSADLWMAVRGGDQSIRLQALQLYLKQ